MHHLESLINGNTFLFVVVCDDDNIIARYDNNFVTLKQNLEINNKYKKTFEFINMKNKYVLDSSNFQPDELAAQIAEIIEVIHG